MIGRTIAHYRIESELGRGGMGVVYRAHDTRLGRTVALKFLPETVSCDAAAVERLYREARAASALNHPHICTIHEIGEAEGLTYIAMEHIEGRPLRAMIPPDGMPVESALRFGIHVADALAHAHERGIAHRDLKTLNILVTPDSRAKILDFGLAQPLRKDVLDEATSSRVAPTEAEGVAGTLHYLAPEVLHGQPADSRSDIWALGVVLHELVAGRLPFAGRTGFEVCSAILRELPAPLPSAVPPGLRAVILRTLAKDPARRYQHASEVRAALEAIQSETGVSVAPPAPPRANRFRWAVAAAIPLLLLAVLFTTDIGRWRTRLFSSVGEDRIHSLAVLPLKSLSNQSDDDTLGMGIADTIITKVSQTGALTVRPTSAVRKYSNYEKDALAAAQALKVDSVLDGTVQRSGDRLRVNLNLLRVRDGASLWSETFNTKLTDIFAMQDEVAQQVAARLRLRLSASEQARLTKRYTSSPEAYEYFIKGMYNFDKRTLSGNKGSLDAAIVMFGKAVELDPNYALAHAQLAYSYAWIAIFVEPGPRWLEPARREMAQAEALDPGLALLHVVRHELLWSYDEGFQLQAAARELRLAQQKDPSVGHDQLGVLYGHMGLEEAASRELRRALEIDPTSEITISRYVEGFDLLCRPDEALAASSQFGDHPGPTSYLRKSFLWKGQFDEAQRLEEELLRNPQDPWGLSLRALRLGLRGDFRDFEAQIPVIVRNGGRSRAYHHMTYNVACTYAVQGKSEKAVEWLRTTVEFGMPNYTLFARDPHLDRIRKDPAFVRFMGELKLRWDALEQEFAR